MERRWNGWFLALVFAGCGGESGGDNKSGGGVPANNPPPVQSGEGLVVFHSAAADLVPGDTNNMTDVFLHDLTTGTTERISMGLGGQEPNSTSRSATISKDGRYVAFQSWATNLVPNDTNGQADIFVYDRVAQTTERVSVGAGGVQANNWSHRPQISLDGRFVVFQSQATNLDPFYAPGDWRIYLHDRDAGTTELVSITAAGGPMGGAGLPSVSGDGRYVAFDWAGDVYVRDRINSTTETISVNLQGTKPNGVSGGASISADGRYVAFRSDASDLVVGDTNGVTDFFVYDRQTDVTERVNLGPNGEEADAGGDVFIKISPDGSYVVFESAASNLVAGDTNGAIDIFRRDLLTGITERLSATAQVQSSRNPWISPDGKVVAFDSWASDLVPGDTNGRRDAFALQAGVALQRVSVDSQGAEGTADSVLNNPFWD